VAELSALLRAVDLPAKQAALRRVWARMVGRRTLPPTPTPTFNPSLNPNPNQVWRRTLPAPLAAALPGPDAFDTIMEMLRARKAK
tara:strand:+ start:65 stop:319 length:255 start_codon:yes stop_codon:yes gene_type:complete